jgi:hypothetical protein
MQALLKQGFKIGLGGGPAVDGFGDLNYDHGFGVDSPPPPLSSPLQRSPRNSPLPQSPLHSISPPKGPVAVTAPNLVANRMNDDNDGENGEKTTDKDDLNDTKLEKNDNSKSSKTK